MNGEEEGDGNFINALHCSREVHFVRGKMRCAPYYNIVPVHHDNRCRNSLIPVDDCARKIEVEAMKASD